MGSTALIVEILIIGAQTLTWLTLLFLICIGINDTAGLQQLVTGVGAIGSAFSFVALAVAYTVGLVVDAGTALVADKIPNFQPSFKDRALRQRAVDAKLRLSAFEVYSELQGIQFQSRLLRSSLFNLPLIVFLSGYLLVLNDQCSWLVVCLIVPFVAASTYYAYRRRTSRYLRTLELTYTEHVSSQATYSAQE
ncbi:MAG: hypothetical protein AAGL17_09070 [Cyanobacteria bacterium J06576_12]